MAKSKTIEKVGIIAFIVGLLIALVLSAIGPVVGSLAIVLIVLGIIVGIINIGDEEVSHFLLASLVFIISAGSLQEFVKVIPGIGDWLSNFLGAVILFVAPSAAITALRALYEVARNK